MTTIWTPDRPRQQLRRNPGGVLGARTLFPQDWDSITNKPNLDPTAASFEQMFRRQVEDRPSYYIDFMANEIAAGKLEDGWEYSLSGSGAFTITDALNGIARLQGAVSGAGAAYAFVDLGAGTVGSQDIARNPAFFSRWAQVSEAGTERVYCGLCNGWAFGIPVTLPSGLYFDHVPGANINAISSNAGTLTTVDTGLNPVVGTFYRFRIIARGGGTAVDYYINGGRVATITTNLPASAVRLQPGARHDRTSGAPATGTTDWDYLAGYQTRTP